MAVVSGHRELGRCSTRRPNRFTGCKSSTARHLGRLKHIDRSKGFGFIQCDEATKLYGRDVLVCMSDLLEHDVGDTVCFSLTENQRGQPQGTQLKLTEEALSARPDYHDETKLVSSGTIKSFDAVRGYGFISCVQTFEKFGRDVFVHKEQLGNFKVGEGVSFSVKPGSAGYPQAFNLTSSLPSLAWLDRCALPSAKEPSADCQAGKVPTQSELPLIENQVGRVKNINAAKACGFIESEVLHKQFGRDVFFPISLLLGLCIGDHVEFDARVKNGQPQACRIARCDAASRESIAQVPAQIEDPSLQQLTKQLLRACASSGKDSYDRMFELLNAGADPNGRDVTGQTALMVAAFNAGGSEKKCRLLVGMGAEVHAVYKGDLTVLQWAKERISHKFAAHLDALSRGEQVDCVISLHNMGGPSEV